MDPEAQDRPTLMLVDDDLTFCQVLSKALERRGFAVETAHDGKTALSLIDESAPEFAVIDLRLPDMSGLKLVQRLKSTDANTAIVVLTGYGSIATAVESIKFGATQYLTKPSNADDVEKAFKSIQPNLDATLSDKPLSIDRLEWEHIQRVLSDCGDNISATARALNMHRRTLQRKLNKFPPRA